MAILNISYNDLTNASNYAKRTAIELEEYSTKLQRGVARRLGNVSGGGSSATSTALSNTMSKIRELDSKATNLRNYSRKIEKFSENIATTDKAVSKKINTLTKDFADKNGFKVGKVSTFIQYLAVNFVNSTSLGQWIKNAYNKGKDKVNEWKNDIKHWYKTEGGKYLVDIGLGVLAIVAAVVTILTAGVGLIAILATIGAVLAIVNSLTNIVTSFKAYNTIKNGGDPAWAHHYGKLDKFSDVLRNTNNKFLSNVGGILDIVECVTGIVVAFRDIGKLGKKGIDFMGKNGFKSFRQLFGNSTNGSIGKLGSLFMEEKDLKWAVTFKSFTNGLKSLKIKSVRDSLGASFKLMGTEFVDKFKYIKMNGIQSGSVIKNIFSGDVTKKAQSMDIMKNFIKTDIKGVFSSVNNTLKKQIIPEVKFSNIESGLKSVNSIYKNINNVVNNKLTLTPNINSFEKNINKVVKNYSTILDRIKGFA